MIKCGVCGTENRNGAKFCRKCGSSFGQSAKVVPPVPLPPEQSSSGTRAVPVAAASPAVARPAYKSPKTILLVAVGIVLAAVAAFVLISLFAPEGVVPSNPLTETVRRSAGSVVKQNDEGWAATDMPAGQKVETTPVVDQLTQFTLHIPKSTAEDMQVTNDDSYTVGYDVITSIQRKPDVAGDCSSLTFPACKAIGKFASFKVYFDNTKAGTILNKVTDNKVPESVTLKNDDVECQSGILDAMTAYCIYQNPDNTQDVWAAVYIRMTNTSPGPLLIEITTLDATENSNDSLNYMYGVLRNLKLECNNCSIITENKILSDMKKPGKDATSPYARFAPPWLMKVRDSTISVQSDLYEDTRYGSGTTVEGCWMRRNGSICARQVDETNLNAYEPSMRNVIAKRDSSGNIMYIEGNSTSVNPDGTTETSNGYEVVGLVKDEKGMYYEITATGYYYEKSPSGKEKEYAREIYQSSCPLLDGKPLEVPEMK